MSKPTQTPLDDEDNTWVIHGRAYDMRAFIAKHPGGETAIQLGQGRDCTALFESYHALTSDRPWTTLAKYQVNRPAVVNKLAHYKWQEKDAFYEELKEEVKTYFRVNKISRRATIARWFWFWLGWITQWVPIYFYIQGYWLSLILMPIYVWIVSVHHFHDASHFAVSDNQRINTIIAYLYPFFESPTSWWHQHIIGHHSYTNIDEFDPDVLFRITARKKSWRLSYLTWPLWTFAGCFIFDFNFYFVAPYRYKNKVTMAPFAKSLSFYVKHIMSRVLTFYVLHVIPYQWFGGFKGIMWATVPVGVFGTCFAYMTQMSHMAPAPYANRDMESKSWAAHEILTAQNVATQSLASYVFSGSLNLQIEHHLFPSLSGCHYPALVPIVKAACARHNIPYQEVANYWEAFQSHRQMLNETCTESGGMFLTEQEFASGKAKTQ